ncbi:nitrilase-related carbon-nitrogen hydrolase [Motilimonas pumila]|uniref:Apolipoprotein N-acyltransferase n=1 Tax=Motilimonas pumila TaxID=2303987 RepID=A0A418YIG9_9GAMM|nr:nitrilase-related carbon-nitrogen hydrolase [Motilimonas pumila]RJG50430.1 apolipoprotein N-acyltransferase [Motilimonas pumila]
MIAPTRQTQLKIAMLSAGSGLLMGLSMPGYNQAWLAWFALVPVLLLCQWYKNISVRLTILPATVVWSVMAHHWFVDIFGSLLGTILCVAAGVFFSRPIYLAVTLQRHFGGIMRLFALPLVWCSIEFLRVVLPYLEEIWFVLVAKSQWQQLEILQILSLGSFPLLSFIIMLSNAAIACIIIKAKQQKQFDWQAGLVFPLVLASWFWGHSQLTSIPAHDPTKDVHIGATVDLTNQDDAIQSLANIRSDGEGYWADTPAMSQAIFNVNAKLTRQISDNTHFVVWPENEMADINNEAIVRQIKQLAIETSNYIVADLIWREQGELFDVAVMFGPDGVEVGRSRKIAITFRERHFGFSPGSKEDIQVFTTPHGQVGLGVCFDRHRAWISRALRQQGAEIILMPVDDDFKANANFPLLHMTDSIFRAVENRVAYGLGTTSGISAVINPYGKVVSASGVNQREAIYGTTVTSSQQTLYTRYGDWFGWGISAITLYLVITWLRQRRKKS